MDKEKKIFIIEDDVNLLYGLESQFGADDFEVESSQGDEELSELIEAITSFDPDYIILDLLLPKNDGFEVIKKLKEDGDLSGKPIFIFTDLSDDDSRNRSLELGADYYFIKDEFDPYEFSDKVKRIIENKEREEDRDYDE